MLPAVDVAMLPVSGSELLPSDTLRKAYVISEDGVMVLPADPVGPGSVIPLPESVNLLATDD